MPSKIQEQLRRIGKRPPIDRGDLEMRIARDGTWFYRGSPIGRLPLVKLFASVLRREADGRYWLVTPAERGRIEVDDVPFLAVAVTVEGEGRDERLIFRTNLDEFVTAAPTTRCVSKRLRAASRRPIFWYATDSKPGSRGRCFMSSSNSGRRSRSERRRNSGCGAGGYSFGWASLHRIGNEDAISAAGTEAKPLTSTNSFTQDWVIGRFLQLGRPGRRGFGGAADPAEAAALREMTRGDNDLNPGMTPPSTALRPAAEGHLGNGVTASALAPRRSARLVSAAQQIQHAGAELSPWHGIECGVDGLMGKTDRISHTCQCARNLHRTQASAKMSHHGHPKPVAGLQLARAASLNGQHTGSSISGYTAVASSNAALAQLRSPSVALDTTGLWWRERARFSSDAIRAGLLPWLNCVSRKTRSDKSR